MSLGTNCIQFAYIFDLSLLKRALRVSVMAS